MNIVPKNNLSEPAWVHLPSASTRTDRRRLGEGGGAFTLVELLVVIAIIGVLAALILPVASSVSRVKKINTAQAELQEIETAIESYKAKYGVYPPSNPKSPVVNQLYYELTGVTNNGSSYQPLDNNLSVVATHYGSQFNVGGVVNCSKPSGEDTVYAKDFLPQLKPGQVAFTTNGNGDSIYYLVTSVGGPDLSYQPLPGSAANPFRYVNPGTNNPNSYDLWVQLSINSTPSNPHFYLVCNWNQQTLRNSPLP